eukprot:2314878-Pyramimonas_sp.AAC.1
MATLGIDKGGEWKDVCSARQHAQGEARQHQANVVLVVQHHHLQGGSPGGQQPADTGGGPTASGQRRT